MISKTLKQLVVDEALKLREYATREEKDKLNINSLLGNDKYKCIYGQMAGHCYSERAIELLCKCAKPFSSNIDYYSPPTGDAFSTSNFRPSSPIEVYINQPGAKLKDLVNLIKS